MRSDRWRNGRRILGVGSGESSRRLPRVNAREHDVWPGAFEVPELERSKQGLTTALESASTHASIIEMTKNLSLSNLSLRAQKRIKGST
jgi:hypothetical protein